MNKLSSARLAFKTPLNGSILWICVYIRQIQTLYRIWKTSVWEYNHLVEFFNWIISRKRSWYRRRPCFRFALQAYHCATEDKPKDCYTGHLWLVAFVYGAIESIMAKRITVHMLTVLNIALLGFGVHDATWTKKWSGRIIEYMPAVFWVSLAFILMWHN